MVRKNGRVFLGGVTRPLIGMCVNRTAACEDGLVGHLPVTYCPGSQLGESLLDGAERGVPVTTRHDRQQRVGQPLLQPFRLGQPDR